jgi:hypothetical protein
MHAATFRGRRGIACLRAVPARAAGWRLVLDKPSPVPIGEGAANIVPDAGARVFGVLYEITAADLEHVELTEGVRIGNYRRVEIPVRPLHARATDVIASTLVSEQRDPARRPSDRYMACLIAGAEEHGLPAAWVDVLRAVAVRPESEEAARLRVLLDDAFRRDATPRPPSR